MKLLFPAAHPEPKLSPDWLKQIYLDHVSKSRAVGKDGIKYGAFSSRIDEECELICTKVQNGSYRFTTYREKLISRGAHRKPRQISIPTFRDRLLLRASLEYLKFHFPEAHPRPPHIYIKEIKNQLISCREHSSFLRMDICDFYPSLLHDNILSRLNSSKVPDFITASIMKAVSTSTGSQTNKPTTLGVPQGLSISNYLAAIYMIDLDADAADKFFYKRYVDDILVIAASESVNQIYKSLWDQMRSIGLTSHPMGTPGKTETKRLAEGVQYLGYEIAPGRISIRKSSLGKMFSNLAHVISHLRYRKERDRNIFRLNLKITGCLISGSRRGWLMFFSQTDNVSQLSYLDSWLRSELSKLGIDLDKISSFKKSYYEIRYNLEKTSYIPNFDTYDLAQKANVVSALSGKSAAEVQAMNVDALQNEFERLIGREVAELERDLIDSFS